MQSTEPQPAILVDNVRKTFRGATAVDDVSFSIAPGEVLGLLGTNGAGKSTTVDLIAGLLTPTSGRVRVMGLDPVSDRARVRQILGVQLQQANFHDALTVSELIELYRSFYPNPFGTDELLRLVELQEKARTRFGNLSGGQQQRLSIALALVGRPKVVVLDELTTGLDPGARRRIWQTIENLRDETVLLVSHAMDEVERLCNRIVLLDKGRVIAEGTPAEVCATAGAATLEDAFVALTGASIYTEEDAA